MSKKPANRLRITPPLASNEKAYVLSGDDAADLADLAGVERDLEVAAAACRTCYSRRGSPSTDLLRRVCIDAALMRYRRCFTTGRRTRMRDEDLDTLRPSMVKLHNLALYLADKSIAHCVEWSEESIPYLRAEDNAEQKKVHGEVKVVTTSASHHNLLPVRAFERLCRHVGDIAHEKADRMVAEVMRQLKMLPIAEIEALPQLPQKNMSRTEVVQLWCDEAAIKRAKRDKSAVRREKGNRKSQEQASS